MDHVLQVEASKQKVVGKKKEQVLRVKEDRTLHLQQIREQREASRRAAYQVARPTCPATRVAH